MTKLPGFQAVSVSQRAASVSQRDLASHDAVLCILGNAPMLEPGTTAAAPALAGLARVAAAHPDRAAETRIDNKRATLLIATLPPQQNSAFNRLNWARKVVARCAVPGVSRVAILADGLPGDVREALIRDLVAALCAAAFALPSFKAKTVRQKTGVQQLVILGARPRIDLAKETAGALANNVARWFAGMPPNLLDARGYRTELESLARDHGLGHRFYSEKQLKARGAGAFLAVSQGNATQDAGILRLSYKPPKPAAHKLAVVGKGIIFDTGGNNLKPFMSMLNMHMDMQGSAVAAGLVLALAALRVPYQVDAWLAISENRVSARAYKSQDVVTAIDGRTIQVIHTDAEGRMVLADTLALAAQEKPAFMIDFATLTGACETALTSAYSGVFSNRASLHPMLIAAGEASGERVWPFPMDEDFDEGLRSDVADIKQCSEASAGDHILAARFLGKFVPDKLPWVHVDLSASQRKGGLAHVPTECTGFGGRFALELLDQLWRAGKGSFRID